MNKYTNTDLNINNHINLEDKLHNIRELYELINDIDNNNKKKLLTYVNKNTKHNFY